MKKITITVDDEVVTMLDNAVESTQYYNYPKAQAYGIFISDLIRVVRAMPLAQCRQCMYVPPHCHPPSWWL